MTPVRPRLCIGLTGGMGGGKSTATALFAELGFRTLDSDRLVRDEVLREPAVVAAVRERVGDAVAKPGGALDRHVLAKHVFGSDAERLWLEELVHPRVFAAWRRAFASDPAARWVVEVPLLYEKGLENWFDHVVCVATSSAPQLARLHSRGVPADLAGPRIAKQLALPRKIGAADHVLLNDGSLAFLRDQVTWLASRWK